MDQLTSGFCSRLPIDHPKSDTLELKSTVTGFLSWSDQENFMTLG